MSNDVYPVLPGLTFETQRGFGFNTLKSRSVSNKSVAQVLNVVPKRTWNLRYEFLRQRPSKPELKTLVGFFFKHYGNVDTFLFQDPADNAESSQLIGTGNGSNKIFQMRRAYVAGFYEPIQSIDAIAQVRVNGVATAAYTVNVNTGIITFTTAPPNTHSITADFSFFWRVSFAESDMSVKEFAKNFYENGSVKLESEPV